MHFSYNEVVYTLERRRWNENELGEIEERMKRVIEMAYPILLLDFIFL